MKRLTEAETLLRSIVASRKEELGDLDIETLRDMNNLAVNLSMQIDHDNTPGEFNTTVDVSLDSSGKREEAEELFRLVVEGRRSLLGSNHLQTCRAIDNLAANLKRPRHYSVKPSTGL